MTELETAQKFYIEYPDTAFKVAMGQRGALSLGLSSAVYAIVCNEVEKSSNIDLIAELMNSLDNFDISAEAVRRGYRSKDGAVELGKEVRLARIQAFEKAQNTKSFTQTIKEGIGAWWTNK
jgi:hypothetical protein